MTRVAFDLDGTLVDTMPALRALGIKHLTNMGLGEGAAELLYDDTTGLSFADQMRWIWREEHEQVIEAFEEAKRAIYETAKPFASAKPTVQRLLDTGVSVACVTSTRPELAWDLLRRIELPLEFVITTPVSKAVQLTHFQADWFVADAPRDELLASALGIKFIAVSTTFRASRFPRETLYMSLEEVPRAISA